jgi:hypothetical protein
MSETEAIRRINDAKREGKTDLEITHLKLERLPKELFTLSSLKVLIAHNNRLRSLPRELFSLKSLERLFLEYNDLTEIPPEIATLPNLRVLSLNGNQLTALTEALFETRLKELYLARNSLRTLPAEIGRIETLEKLYIGETRLGSLPKELGALRELRALHLPGNHLTELPPELGKLSYLEVLNASDNRLSWIPREVADLPSLRTLNLAKNPLPDAILEGAKAGPAVLREAVERFTLPGLRLRVAGEAPLHEIRACLFALEHAFNSYLVLERVVSDALKTSTESDAPPALPWWPLTSDAVAGWVREPKRLFLREVRMGLTGTVEVATRSTRTTALSHLNAVIRRMGEGKKRGAMVRRLEKKISALRQAGVPVDQIERLTAELLDLPAQALLPFVQRNILRGADLVAPPGAGGKAR